MGFQQIKRWQWVAISLVVGMAMGWLNRMSAQDWTATYGESLSSVQFEAAVGRHAGDNAHFTQLTVVPDEIPDAAGSKRPVYVVTGQYDEARPRRATAGAAAGPNRRCFIAEIPYLPVGMAGPAKATETVMTYLVRERIAFQYAWWRDPKAAMAIWVGGSFIVIGIIWPTLINLLVYRSLFAPAQPKGIDLSKVSSGGGENRTQAMTDADLANLQKLESDLEADLAQSAAEQPLSTPAAAPDPVRPMDDKPVEVAAAETDTNSTVFGAKEGDYYPTARKPRDQHGSNG
ncbi:MAG TPA: hypothetical protein VG269_02200 [Tepidisphaeraceae bacterium]|jgi:hypothetical protein|nr:hypothetical protein [Tepidisphaeraceae bacterium]